MIRTLHLHNFESHKNTLLDFTPGINIITGQSDHGKSSIIRGLYWIKDNKPSGSSIVSFWNRDSKGNAKKSSFAEVDLNGNSIRRERSFTLNGYFVGETKLEAIGQSVPELVTNSINLSEVNIQYQFDRPFLLDESPQEVARFFNKTIRLDLIDRMQSKIENLRRKTNQEISSYENLVEKTRLNIQSYSWIEQADKIASELEKIEKELISDEEKEKKIVDLMKSYHEYREIYLSAKKLFSLKDTVNEIDSIDQLIEQDEEYNYSISALLNSMNEEEEIIFAGEKIKGSGALVEKIDSISTIINDDIQKAIQLKNLIDELETYEETIEQCSKEQAELKADLPEICPTCGQRIVG